VAASPDLGGIGQPNPAPVKQVGAFSVPAAAPTSSGAVAKPTTDHMSLDLGDGSTSAAKPVSIPNVDWKPPVTAVQAKPAAAGGEKMVITYVGDGDSVNARSKSGANINCRIDSIDAPEVAHPSHGKPGQAYGEEAKKTLQDMILNKEVTVRVTKPSDGASNYGRSLCQIEISGQGVDKAMVKAGMAWLYRRYNNDAELSKLETEARSARRGLWADPNPVNPETFRHMGQYGR
jgi:endonuclease YncB( thermonuclease family)